MQWRRILIIILAVFIFLGVVGGAGTYTIAARAPFVPGDWLFPAQVWAEQTWSLTFNKDQEQQVAVLLAILERRLDSLEAVQGTDFELLALSYLDAALDQALVAINELPTDLRPGWEARLLILTERALALMDGLDVVQADPVDTAVATLLTKLESLQRITATANSSATDWAGLLALQSDFTDSVNAQTEDGANLSLLADARNVPFLQGNVDHSFFPLQGGHAQIDCETCHQSGSYQGTDARCITCHAPDDNHNGTYGTDCTICHNINSWQQVTYDHRFIGSNDCSTCHTPPANHFEGACRDCHSDTGNFRNATFDHSRIGSQDCATCHNPPANHYAGACRACHNDTTNFRNATFNHATIGGTDCAACHNPPVNHYAGACRDCHGDTSNFRNASFSHSGIGSKDCSSCHTPPQGHYSGACRDCHGDTTNFRNASFNHASIGGQDCSACHNPPPGHFAGACTTCHQDTRNFRNANFSHANIGSQDCSACHNPPPNHFGGACTTCHQDTGNFHNANFSHANIGGQDCSACHNPPGNHFPGPCTSCHQDTGNFKNANFNHSGLTDCQSCHARPSNHFQGQCSDCHNTNSWGGASFNHSFPIGHKNADGDCSKCHPGGDTSTYTCNTCHDYGKMDREHQDENNYSHNCVACHADGKEHD